MAKSVKRQTTPSKRSRRLVSAAVAIIIVLVPVVYFYSASLSQPVEAKAAIIDQLGSSKLDQAVRYENQTFIESAMELLSKRFSVIDYYSDNATVEEYSKLASAGYRFILWRAHSAEDNNSKYIAISTTDTEGSINYDQYPDGSLALCEIIGDPTHYIGITPTFIDQVMTGTFQDTVIVLMSCNGLEQGYLKTAQALEAKGAKVIISWDSWVSTSDNDYATSLLLENLIDENDTIGVAVSKIPASSSEFYAPATLQYDPVNPDVTNYRIPDYRTNGSANVALVTLPVFRKVEELMDN